MGSGSVTDLLFCCTYGIVPQADAIYACFGNLLLRILWPVLSRYVRIYAPSTRARCTLHESHKNPVERAIAVSRTAPHGLQNIYFFDDNLVDLTADVHLKKKIHVNSTIFHVQNALLLGPLASSMTCSH